jgi:hypothetical protein
LPLAIHKARDIRLKLKPGAEMTEVKAAVKGTASMWALSSDKQTVRLTVPATGVATLRVEFDLSSLEATLATLVQMHFEMLRTAPVAAPYIKH